MDASSSSSVPFEKRHPFAANWARRPGMLPPPSSASSPPPLPSSSSPLVLERQRDSGRPGRSQSSVCRDLGRRRRDCSLHPLPSLLPLLHQCQCDFACPGRSQSSVCRDLGRRRRDCSLHPLPSLLPLLHQCQCDFARPGRSQSSVCRDLGRRRCDCSLPLPSLLPLFLQCQRDFGPDHSMDAMVDAFTAWTFFARYVLEIDHASATWPVSKKPPSAHFTTPSLQYMYRECTTAYDAKVMCVPTQLKIVFCQGEPEKQACIVTPNGVTIPQFYKHAVNVHARVDGLYHLDDPMRWPQLLRGDMDFYSCVRAWPTTDPDDPLFMSSFRLDVADFKKGPRSSLRGSIHPRLLIKLRAMREWTMGRVNEYMKRPEYSQGYAGVFRLLTTMMSVSLVRLEDHVDFIVDVRRTLGDLQRAVLLLDAFFTFQTLKEKYGDALIPEIAPVRHDLMGAFTFDLDGLETLYKFGIPVYYIKPYELDGTAKIGCVTHWSTPEHLGTVYPSRALEADDANPPFPMVYSGDRSPLIMRAIFRGRSISRHSQPEAKLTLELLMEAYHLNGKPSLDPSLVIPPTAFKNTQPPSIEDSWARKSPEPIDMRLTEEYWSRTRPPSPPRRAIGRQISRDHDDQFDGTYHDFDPPYHNVVTKAPASSSTLTASSGHTTQSKPKSTSTQLQTSSAFTSSSGLKASSSLTPRPSTLPPAPSTLPPRPNLPPAIDHGYSGQLGKAENEKAKKTWREKPYTPASRNDLVVRQGDVATKLPELKSRFNPDHRGVFHPRTVPDHCRLLPPAYVQWTEALENVKDKEKYASLEARHTPPPILYAFPSPYLVVGSNRAYQYLEQYLYLREMMQDKQAHILASFGDTGKIFEAPKFYKADNWRKLLKSTNPRVLRDSEDAEVGRGFVEFLEWEIQIQVQPMDANTTKPMESLIGKEMARVIVWELAENNNRMEILMTEHLQQTKRVAEGIAKSEDPAAVAHELSVRNALLLDCFPAGELFVSSLPTQGSMGSSDHKKRAPFILALAGLEQYWPTKGLDFMKKPWNPSDMREELTNDNWTCWPVFEDLTINFYVQSFFLEFLRAPIPLHALPDIDMVEYGLTGPEVVEEDTPMSPEPMSD